MKRTINEVLDMDERLRELATYEAMGGRMILPKSMEDVMELQDKIVSKFNEFKGLLKSGECTYDFIQQTVLDKNGPFPSKDLDIDDPNFFSLLEKQKKQEQTEAEYKKQDMVFLNKMMDSFYKNFADNDSSNNIVKTNNDYKLCDCDLCRKNREQDRAEQNKHSEPFDFDKKINELIEKKKKNTKKKE